MENQESKTNTLCSNCMKEIRERKKREKPEQIFECNKCNVTFETNANLRKHMKLCYGSFTCPYYQNIFDIFTKFIDIQEHYLNCVSTHSNVNNIDIDRVFLNELTAYILP